MSTRPHLHVIYPVSHYMDIRLKRIDYKDFVKYGVVALLLLGVAIILRLWPLNILGNRLPYITFYPAVLFASIYGGFFTGLFTSLMSSVYVCLWSSADGKFINDYIDVVGLILFNANGVMFSIVGEIMHRTRRRMTNTLIRAGYLARALDRISAFVYMKDRSHHYIYANKPTLNLFQCSEEELIFKDDYSFFPADTVQHLHEIDKRVFNAESTQEEINSVDLDGRHRVYWEVKTPIFDESDPSQIIGLCGISTDITERKQREDALRESEERFHSIFDAAAIGMAVVSLEGRFIQSNEALCRTVGYSADELAQKSFQEITHPDDLEADLALVQQLLDGTRINYQIEKRYFHKNGHVIWILLAGSVVHDENGHIKYFIAQIMDISDRKSLMEKLELQAHQDHLTGLYNRLFFLEEGEIELYRAKRLEYRLCLLMIDIDFFKKINDTYGHHIGDLVLQNLSQILRQALRAIDIIGRIGGEEFAILLPQSSIEDAYLIAERIRIIIENSELTLERGSTVNYTVSIGVAEVKEPDTSLLFLLNEADKALYLAKNSGRNKVCLAD